MLQMGRKVYKNYDSPKKASLSVRKRGRRPYAINKIIVMRDASNRITL